MCLRSKLRFWRLLCSCGINYSSSWAQTSTLQSQEVRTLISLIIPSLCTCNRLFAEGTESFISSTQFALPLNSITLPWYYSSRRGSCWNIYVSLSRPSIHPLVRLNGINNTQLPAFITLIIWIVEEGEKNQSAKCWLRGFEGHSGAVFPHYNKWGVTVMLDRAHMATYCNLVHCNC